MEWGAEREKWSVMWECGVESVMCGVESVKCEVEECEV